LHQSSSRAGTTSKKRPRDTAGLNAAGIRSIFLHSINVIASVPLALPCIVLTACVLACIPAAQGKEGSSARSLSAPKLNKGQFSKSNQPKRTGGGADATGHHSCARKRQRVAPRSSQSAAGSGFGGARTGTRVKMKITIAPTRAAAHVQSPARLNSDAALDAHVSPSTSAGWCSVPLFLFHVHETIP